MTNKRPFSPEEFKKIYSKVPRLCVDLIIKTPGGIALSLRSIEPYKGEWHFPGGTVFYKEKITDTIERVAIEETGIPLKADKLLGYIEYPTEDVKGRGFGYTVSMAFLCLTDRSDLKPSKESLEIRTFKKLPPNLIEEQRNFLEKIKLKNL